MDENKPVTAVERLAQEHWEWVRCFIEAIREDIGLDDVVGEKTGEYLYKTAFIHGYKHGCRQAVSDLGPS